MKTYRIACIPGDGIGKEVIPAGERVLAALAAADGSFRFDFEHFPWGGDHYRAHGEMMPADGLDALRDKDAILFGSAGDPHIPDHVTLWGLRLKICQGFDQYANVRPTRVLPGIDAPLKRCGPGDLDWVIVRENSEGEYAGVGGRAHQGHPIEVATDVNIMTRAGVERIMRYAFRLAESRPRRHLTVVTKSNAQRHAMVMWDEIAAQVAREFPTVTWDKELVDAATARMVNRPASLDTIVATNLHADILSDLAAALAGSLGIAPTGNIDPERRYPSMFEPIHGSAFDIMGKGLANPVGTFWSAVMLLEHIGEPAAAARLMRCIEAVTADPALHTRDLGGTATTEQVTRAVCDRIAADGGIADGGIADGGIADDGVADGGVAAGIAGPASGPLASIRVVELGQLIAGPFAAKTLADFGADVIKIEPPDTGDPLRKWRMLKDGTSVWWQIQSRNKRSLALDLKQPDAQAAVRALALEADVLIENFRPGAMEGFGLDPEDLMRANPRLIVLRVSGYGQTGPYRDKPGFGVVAEAMGGLRHLSGEPGRTPVRVGISIGDTLAALHGVIGILLALQERHRSGRGQVIDVALYEAVFNCMESLLPEYSAFGAVRGPAGSALPGIAPSNAYACRDGYALIAGNGDSIFKRLMQAIGRDDLARDPALADNAGRVARVEEIDAAIGHWSAQRSVDAVLAALDAAAVPAGRIYTVADIAQDPHYQARGMLQTITLDDGSRLTVPGIVPKLSRTPGAHRRNAPAIGQDNDEILAELARRRARDI